MGYGGFGYRIRGRPGSFGCSAATREALGSFAAASRDGGSSYGLVHFGQLGLDSYRLISANLGSIDFWAPYKKSFKPGAILRTQKPYFSCAQFDVKTRETDDKWLEMAAHAIILLYIRTGHSILGLGTT
jgi:hypothetical protein